MQTLDAASKKNLEGVHPDLQRVVRYLALTCPMPFRVTEGVRTLARQKQLKASGNSKTLNSRHLTGHAVDIVPMEDANGDSKINGEDMWHHAQLVKLSVHIKAAFKKCGVPYTWGGDWKNGWDKPHWELPWKKYPIRTAALNDLDLMEALLDDPYGDVDFTPTTKAVATSSTIGLAGAGLLADTVYQLERAQEHLTVGNVIGTLIGALMISGAVLDLYGRWADAGKPYPRILDRWLKRKQVAA